MIGFVKYRRIGARFLLICLLVLVGMTKSLPQKSVSQEEAFVSSVYLHPLVFDWQFYLT